MLSDSHIHLSHPLFDGEVTCVNTEGSDETLVTANRDVLVDKMKKAGIAFCVEPAIELESNARILQYAGRYSDFLYPAIGLHPTRSFQTKWKYRKELEDLSKNTSVVAIGELGLDYHYERKKQHRMKQMAWFVWQLYLADQRQLPVILRIRLADRDAIRILRCFKKKLHGGVCHCFCGTAELAKIYTGEFGLLLGIGGSLLQENQKELEEAVRETPLEFLLLETDAPYIKPKKPENVSGKKWKKARNTSLIIPDIAERIAKIKGISVSEVEKVTTENARKLFGIQDYTDG